MAMINASVVPLTRGPMPASCVSKSRASAIAIVSAIARRPAAESSPDEDCVAVVPELVSQPQFQSFGFGASLDRVVSLVEPWFQAEAQPLAPPFTALPEIAGRLVANLVLSKSLLGSQGGLTDVYVRVLRIESESSLIRNLNHVNPIHFRAPRRVRTSHPAAPSHASTSRWPPK